MADKSSVLVGRNASATVMAELFDCALVISMLPDHDAVLDLALDRRGLGFAIGLKRGAVLLSMSTISTAAATCLSKEHARHGQGHVAAQVLGNPDAAGARQLFIVMVGILTIADPVGPEFVAPSSRSLAA